MFNEQRALFQGAFDAQAANLAGTVGSATVVSQVADSRFIVDETQTAAGYTEAIEPLPNCGAASAVDQASCEAIRGCAYGACTSSPLLSTRRMRWVSLLASFATCISAFASCNSPWLHHMHSTHSRVLCSFGAAVSSTCTALVVACPASIPSGNHHTGGHAGHENACNSVHSATATAPGCTYALDSTTGDETCTYGAHPPHCAAFILALLEAPGMFYERRLAWLFTDGTYVTGQFTGGSGR